MQTTELAGRALDAAIAARVMGLHVIAPDWPCGWIDGDYTAAEHREPPIGPGFTQQDQRRYRACYSERGPVYHDADLDLPRPVPFYSQDIAAAWQVVEEITKIQRSATLANTRFAWWWDRAHLWANSAEEAATEICRAALAALAAT